MSFQDDEYEKMQGDNWGSPGFAESASTVVAFVLIYGFYTAVFGVFCIVVYLIGSAVLNG